MPSRPTSFRSTTVKPFLQIEAGLETELEDDIEEERPEEERPVEQPNDRTTPLTVKRRRGRPRKHPLPKATNTLIVNISIFIQELTFKNSRRSKINGLLEKGVFEPITIEDVLQGVCIFNSRFVNEIKHLGTDKAFEKSRLVIQAYNNQGKDVILT